MLSKLSFKTKLLFLCLLLSSVGVIVGVSNYVTSKTVIEDYEDVALRNMPNIHNTDLMFLEFRRMRINLTMLGIPGIPKEVVDEALKNITDSEEAYEKANKDYLAIEFFPGEKEKYDQLQACWERFKALSDRMVGLYNSGKAEDRDQLIKDLYGESADLAHEYTRDIKALASFHTQTADAHVKEAREDHARANMISFLIIGLGLTGGMGVGYLFSASISKGLQEVSNGLADGAAVVETVAQQIASASDSLSASTTQQAAALQETTAAIEETSAMISKNAENAKVSSEVSEQSQATASRGQQAVTDMLQSIEEISHSNNEIMQQIEESNREISEIVKVIAEIGNKTKVINDIVFQTKLLSFNASVEAARAGEHGKGFAVVAEEVGNLAQMSGNSAKEISEMLEGSIKKVELIVQNTQSRVGSLVQAGKEKVNTGTVTAKRCSEILEEIVTNVSRVGSLVSEISVASQEQSKGVSEINKAMSELDNVAQQNSAASQQAATSAEDLKSQVAGVRQMVLRLNEVLMGEGSKLPVRTPATPAEVRENRKVVAFKPKAAKPKKVSHAQASEPMPMKKVSGLEVPRGDDSGFDEA